MSTSQRGSIRTAIAGVGNCASSLVQAVSYCRVKGADAVGVSFPELGGYRPEDIEIVAGFDVDRRKVNRPIGEAVLADPNCTEIFWDKLDDQPARVHRGPDLDGVSAFMRNQPPELSFVPSDEPPLSKDQIVAALKDAQAEVLVIFLPVGSTQAVEFYAQCALEAGCAVVNGIPVFLASNPAWAKKFEDAGLPILGDDFKAQFGATVVHRTLAHLADMRGVKIDRTYQLNVGGNTDFMNMMDMDRLALKRESKTEAVQAAMDSRLADGNIRIGPSDYVPWLHDRKVAYVRIEGQLLGGARTSMEVRLEVEDSPNAAAMAITAVRCARISLERGLKGAVPEASAFLFKHPPEQVDDPEAHDMLLAFAEDARP
ncbi:inositol-3-phosphate synthase [Psychromarinibacter halotolerans]|uniref:Inositol-3-phosphate synthase n=1 Tax=Psychromarinibacter halotolerans TaxID=1775175 RepID=A0ABV7GSR2_9RHOB|nr:inositol-3-phosphate synthase [Psychromarinibacter halotolerans]MAQ83583.1 inositol-3-phosphate synthase [Maritimibacter sp.]MDF0594749.1 inositol-3-phosphate synthase [Psychromarinibacter halotolerans]